MIEFEREREDPVKKYFRLKDPESFEGVEFGRFTCGYDIVFSWDKAGSPHEYIVEVNGHNSGNETSDTTTSPSDRSRNIMTKIRNTIRKEYEAVGLFSSALAYSLFEGGVYADLASKIVHYDFDSQNSRERTEDELLARLNDKYHKKRAPFEKYPAFKDFTKIVTVHDFDIWQKKWEEKLDINFDTLRELLQLYIRTPMNTYSYVNRTSIEDMLSDKMEMRPLIEPEQRTITWSPGMSFASPSGYWIVKARQSARQRHISILSDAQLEEMYIRDPGVLDTHVVQDLKITRKPDNAPEEFTGRNTFMRLRLDVVCRRLQSGDIHMQIANGDSVMCVFGHKKKGARGTKGLPPFANIDFAGRAKYFKPSKPEVQMALDAVKGTNERIARLLLRFNEYDVLRETLRNQQG